MLGLGLGLEIKVLVFILVLKNSLDYIIELYMSFVSLTQLIFVKHVLHVLMLDVLMLVVLKYVAKIFIVLDVPYTFVLNFVNCN